MSGQGNTALETCKDIGADLEAIEADARLLSTRHPEQIFMDLEKAQEFWPDPTYVSLIDDAVHSASPEKLFEAFKYRHDVCILLSEKIIGWNDFFEVPIDENVETIAKKYKEYELYGVREASVTLSNLTKELDKISKEIGSTRMTTACKLLQKADRSSKFLAQTTIGNFQYHTEIVTHVRQTLNEIKADIQKIIAIYSNPKRIQEVHGHKQIPGQGHVLTAAHSFKANCIEMESVAVPYFHKFRNLGNMRREFGVMNNELQRINDPNLAPTHGAGLYSRT